MPFSENDELVYEPLKSSFSDSDDPVAVAPSPETPAEESPSLLRQAFPDFPSVVAGGLGRSKRGRQSISRFVQGVAGGVAGLPEAMGITSDAIARVTIDAVADEKKAALAKSLATVEDQPLYQLGRWIRKKTAEAFPIDEKIEKSFFGDTLPQGAGSMVGFMAGGVAGKALKIPAALSVATLGAATTGAEAFDEATKAGANDEDAFKVFAINAGLGTTEAIPIAGWLNRMNKASGNKLKAAIIEGSEEAVQEIFQQVGGNLTAQKYYDPDRKIFEGAVEGGAAGFTLGSVMSLVVSAIGGRRARLPTEEEPAPGRVRRAPITRIPAEQSDQEKLAAQTIAIEQPQAASPVAETPVAPAPAQVAPITNLAQIDNSLIVAKELGFTVEPAMNMDGVPPEVAAKIPPMVRLTDKRAPTESPTAGLSFSVPANAAREQIEAEFARARQGYTPPVIPSSPQVQTGKPAPVVGVPAPISGGTAPAAGAKTPKSSTQLTLPPANAAPFQAFAKSIPDAEVYHKADESGQEDFGIETAPHITVLYGLTKHEPAEVAKIVAAKGPITVTLGKLSIFESKDYDVLKVDVHGDDIRALNKEIAKLPNEQTYPDYTPHLTIAYLKKGEGKKYVGDKRFNGMTLTFPSMTFSPPKEIRATTGAPELPFGSAPAAPVAKPKPGTARAPITRLPNPTAAMDIIAKGDWIEYVDDYGKTHQGKIDEVWTTAAIVPTRSGVQTRKIRHEFSIVDASGKAMISPKQDTPVKKIAEPVETKPAIPAITLPQTTAEAIEMGRAAFAAGKKRVVPPELLTKERWIAERWYQGWDKANIAAPVPETPTEPTPAAESATKLDAIRAKREEIKARLRKKLGGQTNLGVDPEVAIIAAELAVNYTQEGVVRFSDFAKRVKAELPDIWDALKQYLRGAWTTVADASDNLDEVSKAEAKSVLDGIDTETTPTESEPSERPIPERQPSPPVSDVEAPPISRPPGATRSGRVGGNQPEASEGVGEGREPLPESAGGERPSGGSEQIGGSGRSEPSGAARGQRTVRRAKQPVDRNYVITDADQLGQGTPKAKAAGNLAAISLVKRLVSENRLPTAEEKAVLVKYVGWGGGIKGIFVEDNDQFTRERAELKKLLTEEEFAAARASIQDAHYTSQTVITRGIYAAMRRLGFTGGKMVEGGVGIGNFIGLMPAEWRGTSPYIGIERDPLTAKIAQYLYPEARIHEKGYQDADLARDSFDGGVGNPPFGNKAIYDKRFTESSKHSIHNYFIGKTLELTRPGGVTGFVVSRYFLDSADPIARAFIATKGEFLGAIRLPNTAFKENAGTEVVTDLVFFKRVPDGAATDTDWTKATNFKDPKSGLSWKVNSWIAAHPEMILGEMTQAKHGLYGKEDMSVEPRPNQDLGADLDKAVENLPQNVYEPTTRDTSERLTKPEQVIPEGVKVGGFFVRGGNLFRRMPDVNGERQEAPAVLKEGTADRVKAIIPIRDALNRLVKAELAPDSSEPKIAIERTSLNRVYDSFVKRFGFLNSSTNRRAFYDDADSMRVLGLERDYASGISPATAKKKGVDAIAPTAKKADIFTKRVNAPYREVTSVETPKEALMVSLNQRGGVDPAYMAELTGKDRDTVLGQLEGLVFETPEGTYESKEQYLSGNVRQKLKDAQAAGDKFAKNVEALTAVIPKDIDPTDIIAPIGAPWIEARDVAAFAEELTDSPPSAALYQKSNAGWLFTHNDRSTASTQKWGTPRMPFGEMMKLLLNGKPIIVYDFIDDGKGSEQKVVSQADTELANAKASELKDKWQEWVWSNKDRRDRLHRIYNDTYNNYVDFKADGSHMTLPGASPIITLNPHQKNVVWRTITTGGDGLLYDQVVGSGKTFAAIGAMMEMKRLGRVHKWLVTVPNHLTGQWADSFNILYPNANILAAKPSDFTKENRQKLFSKILTGDYDAVVLGHSSLKKVGTSPEVERDILNELLAEIVETIQAMKDAEGSTGRKGGSRAVAAMEKTKDNIKAKIDRLADITGRDAVAMFEELGFDGMVVDEAHEFKNLFYTTQMQNVAGLGTPAGSAKAFDLYLKTRYLRNQFGGKAPIVFLTGTPISNSLVEMFTMQRYLQPKVLADIGLKTLDAWARVFADVRPVYEVDPTGTGYRMATRLANFQNVGELTAIYRNMADVVTMDDLQAQAEAAGKRFPVPKVQGGKPDNIVADRTPEQAEYFGIETQVLDSDGKPSFDTEGNPVMAYPDGTILWRVDNMPDDPREDNMLKLTSDARKAGLDMRLVNPSSPDRPESKINRAVSEITRIHKLWNDQKGTQLVFCDLSVPASARGRATKRAKTGGGGYYIQVQGALKPVDAEPVTLVAAPTHEFFVRKGSFGQWVVSERTSGLSLGGAPTKTRAIAAAEERLSKMEAGLFERSVQEQQPTPEMLGEFLESQRASEKPETEVSDEADDTGGEQGVSIDELMADQSSFSVYDDMKAKLIKAGIPANQIAFIHDFDTPEKKMKLFKSVNAGDVRVLFGSTPKMGAGTNVQRRIVALHHMDAPWRPSDLEQREGRAIRQGNLFYEEAMQGYANPQDYEKDPKSFALEIKRYATRLTYDTRMWQLIEHKAAGIDGFRKADRSTRRIEDFGGEAANASDMKAAASGDPMIQQELQLRNDLNKLQLLKKAWDRNRIELQNREAYLRDYEKRYQSKIHDLDNRKAFLESHTPKDDKGKEVFAFTMPDGKATDEKGVPLGYVADMLKEGKRGYFGEYRGYDFSFEPAEQKLGDQIIKSVTFYLGKNAFSYNHRVTSFVGDERLTGVGLFQRLDNYLEPSPLSWPGAESARDHEKATLEEVRAESAKVFPKEEQLSKIRTEHESVRSQLMNKKRSRVAPPPDAASLAISPQGWESIEPDPEFKPLTKAEVQEAVAKENVYGFKVNVVSVAEGKRMAELESDGKYSLPDRIAGMFYDGEIFLFYDGLTKGDVGKVIREEAAHGLLRTAEGSRMVSKFLSVSDADLQAIRDISPAYAAMSEENLKHEFIAKAARENQTWWQRAVEAVKTFLSRFGLKLSNQEAARALLRAVELSGEVTTQVGEEPAFSINPDGSTIDPATGEPIPAAEGGNEEVQVNSIVFEVRGVDRMTPAEKAIGVTRAQEYFEELGLPGKPDTSKGTMAGSIDTNLVYIIESDGENHDDLGERLLAHLTDEIKQLHQATGSPAYVAALVNAITKNYSVGNMNGVFSKSMADSLVPVAVQVRSFAGSFLRALTGIPVTMANVARNADWHLRRLHEDMFGGDLVRKVIDRIALNFRERFTGEEIERLYNENPILQELFLKVISRLRVKPSLRDVIAEIFATRIDRQDDIVQKFVDTMVNKFSATPSEAERLKAEFGRTFEKSFAAAREKAQAKALAALLPEERKIIGAQTPLWKKLTDLVNSGWFDSAKVVEEYARSKGMKIPTEAELERMRNWSIREQALREPTLAEIEASDTPTATARAAAVTLEKRQDLLRLMNTQWSRWTHPTVGRKTFFSDIRDPVKRYNSAMAANEWLTANLLLKLGFGSRQIIDVGTQMVLHTPTRAAAYAFEQWSNDKSSGRDTNLLHNLSQAMSDAYRARLKVLGDTLASFRRTLAGKGEQKNVEQLLSSIAVFDRMLLQADEMKAAGRPAAARLLTMLALTMRFGRQFAAAADVIQGVPAEAQEMAHQIRTGLREQGKGESQVNLEYNTILGLLTTARTESLSQARQMLEARPDMDLSNASVQRAAWHILREKIYAAGKAVGLPTDAWQAQNHYFRNVIGWNEPETAGAGKRGGPGGFVAATAQIGKEVMAKGGIPAFPFVFGNAMGIALNRKLAYSPLGLFPGIFKGSPWFEGERNIRQRKIEAILGTTIGSTLFTLAALGLWAVLPRRWPDDDKERAKWTANGWAPGMLIIPAGDREMKISTRVGPMALLSPYLAAGGAFRDAMTEQAKKQSVLDERARKLGLTAEKLEGLDPAQWLGVVGAAAYSSATGGRTASGMLGSYTDFGNFSPKKTAASATSTLIPGLPGYQEISRMAGANINPKVASFWDLLVPLPTSDSNRVNLLGDPMRNENDVERIFQVLSGGTSPFPRDSEAFKKNKAYTNLFESDYRPPSIVPSRGYQFGNEFRPMREAELQRYTTARGVNFAKELQGIDVTGMSPEVAKAAAKAAFDRANAAALESVSAVRPAPVTQPRASAPTYLQRQRSDPRAVGAALWRSSRAPASTGRASFGRSRTRRASLRSYPTRGRSRIRTTRLARIGRSRVRRARIYASRVRRPRISLS